MPRSDASINRDGAPGRAGGYRSNAAEAYSSAKSSALPQLSVDLRFALIAIGCLLTTHVVILWRATECDLFSF